MQTEHIIAALRAKREALAAELRQVEKRAASLRGNMLTLDSTIRIFDPAGSPETPRGAIQRAPNGSFSRAVLGVLREAKTPLSCRQIAERVAPICRLDASTTHAMTLLTNRVRGTLARKRIGLAAEQRGDTVFWRVE